MLGVVGAPAAYADEYTLDFTAPSPFTATFELTGNQATSLAVAYEGTTYHPTSFDYSVRGFWRS